MNKGFFILSGGRLDHKENSIFAVTITTNTKNTN